MYYKLLQISGFWGVEVGKGKKKEVEKDDYSKIIRNISRHFNNKAVMRDKIVPKVYCKPLSGIKLIIKSSLPVLPIPEIVRG